MQQVWYDLCNLSELGFMVKYWKFTAFWILLIIFIAYMLYKGD